MAPSAVSHHRCLAWNARQQRRLGGAGAKTAGSITCHSTTSPSLSMASRLLPSCALVAFFLVHLLLQSCLSPQRVFCERSSEEEISYTWPPVRPTGAPAASGAEKTTLVADAGSGDGSIQEGKLRDFWPPRKLTGGEEEAVSETSDKPADWNDPDVLGISRRSAAWELTDIIKSQGAKMKKELNPSSMSWKQIYAFKRLKEKKRDVRRNALLGTFFFIFGTMFAMGAIAASRHNSKDSIVEWDEAGKTAMTGGAAAGSLASFFAGIAMWSKLARDLALKKRDEMAVQNLT